MPGNLNKEIGKFMIKQITAAALLAATSFAASAAEPRFYVGADIDTTKSHFIEDLDRETGYGAFAGFKINDKFDVEVGYRQVGKFNVFQKNDLKVNQLAVSVLGYAPVAEKTAVFGRLGYNRLEFKGNAGSENKNRALVGIGLSYEFIKQITGRVEIQRTGFSSTTVNAGVAYNF